VDGYLLDTCVISALLDARHKNYENVRRADESIEVGAPRFVSRISIAELMFGIAVYDAEVGASHPRASAVLRRAQQEYPIREITKHTAAEYAELRKNLAVTFLEQVPP
jgi:predicted nucleic acid-binding protein